MDMYNLESEMSSTILPLDGLYNNHFLRALCVLGIELGAAEMKTSKIFPIFYAVYKVQITKSPFPAWT